MLADAELAVSELASNAIYHGQGQIILRAWLDDDRLLVEVIDEGPGFERQLRQREFGQIFGWGLGIVEDVSSRWGVHDGPTDVWFELERSGPRLGRPEDATDCHVASAVPAVESVVAGSSDAEADARRPRRASLLRERLLGASDGSSSAVRSVILRLGGGSRRGGRVSSWVGGREAGTA